MTYNESDKYVKDRRAVANPNMTFIAQLICFYKRLYEPSYDNVPVSPRIFSIGSHEIEDPERVVARMVIYSKMFIIIVVNGKSLLRKE
jgi:hypothetical protein